MQKKLELTPNETTKLEALCNRPQEEDFAPHFNEFLQSLSDFTPDSQSVAIQSALNFLIEHDDIKKIETVINVAQNMAQPPVCISDIVGLNFLVALTEKIKNNAQYTDIVSQSIFSKIMAEKRFSAPNHRNSDAYQVELDFIKALLQHNHDGILPDLENNLDRLRPHLNTREFNQLLISVFNNDEILEKHYEYILKSCISQNQHGSILSQIDQELFRFLLYKQLGNNNDFSTLSTTEVDSLITQRLSRKKIESFINKLAILIGTYDPYPFLLFAEKIETSSPLRREISRIADSRRLVRSDEKEAIRTKLTTKISQLEASPFQEKKPDLMSELKIIRDIILRKMNNPHKPDNCQAILYQGEIQADLERFEEKEKEANVYNEVAELDAKIQRLTEDPSITMHKKGIITDLTTIKDSILNKITAAEQENKSILESGVVADLQQFKEKEKETVTYDATNLDSIKTALQHSIDKVKKSWNSTNRAEKAQALETIQENILKKLSTATTENKPVFRSDIIDDLRQFAAKANEFRDEKDKKRITSSFKIFKEEIRVLKCHVFDKNELNKEEEKHVVFKK